MSSVNGIALVIAIGHAVVVGIICYAWGYTDGLTRRDAKGGRR